MSGVAGWPRNCARSGRYELGNGLKLKEVESLLDHYQVTGSVRENLLGMAQDDHRSSTSLFSNVNSVTNSSCMSSCNR
jgi:hypothetical protein